MRISGHCTGFQAVSAFNSLGCKGYRVQISAPRPTFFNPSKLFVATSVATFQNATRTEHLGAAVVVTRPIARGTRGVCPTILISMWRPRVRTVPRRCQLRSCGAEHRLQSYCRAFSRAATASSRAREIADRLIERVGPLCLEKTQNCHERENLQAIRSRDFHLLVFDSRADSAYMRL